MTVKPSGWQTEEKASHKGRTPLPLLGFSVSDVSCTPVININPQLSLGAGAWAGLGTASPCPTQALLSWGFSSVPGKAAGESLSWQLVSQGWGRVCYTTLTFGVESSGKSKPTRIHQQLGTAAALVLCSPPLPSQGLQGSNSQGRMEIK